MVAPLWQLSVSSQHMVKSLTLNPYNMSLCNLKLCTVFGQQISILDRLTLDFLVRLGLNFHPMGEFGRGWGDWASDIFLSRTETCRASRALLREARLKSDYRT